MDETWAKILRFTTFFNPGGLADGEVRIPEAETGTGGLDGATKNGQSLQDGAPKIAKLPYKWLYGRYNYS